MENERDISFDSQQKFKAQIYERKKLTTIFEITCVIIQNVNSGSVFWKAMGIFLMVQCAGVVQMAN